MSDRFFAGDKFHCRLFAALLLFMCGASASAAATPDPIPHLLSADYAAVEQIMQAVQDDYKRAAITDEELLAAFRAFYFLDTSEQHHLDRWIERYPKSYVAHLARGIHYKQLGFNRPRDNSKDTKRKAMKRAHDLAARDLYASIELDDKPLLSYFHAIDIGGWIGRRPPRLLLNAANAIDPDNFIVRHEFLLSLRSMTDMRAFVADSKAVLPPEHIRRLESEVRVEETQRALRGGNDPARAERLYREVLEFDPGNTTAAWYLLYALVNRQKCTEAIEVANLMMATPDARAGEVLARRGWCYLRQNQIADGVADFQRAAELGDVWAQKELAGLYWFGKHVARDVDSARHWMRQAAEQGDEEAQREMQRSFGVTIASSAPETKPRWVNKVLFGAGGLALIAFAVWWRRTDRVTVDADERHMRFPRLHLFVGIVAGIGFGYAAWVGFYIVYLPLRSERFVVPALFTTMALYIVVQSLTVRHELLADGALLRKFGGWKVRLKWADLRSIRYMAIPRWYRLESKSGDVVRISVSMTGLQPFARAVLAHAEQAIADEFTRGMLEAMSTGWAPSASDEDSRDGAS